MSETSDFQPVLNQRKLEFKKSDRSFSLEVLPGAGTFDVNELADLRSRIAFCSVPWHLKSYDQLVRLDRMPALRLANRLQMTGRQVVVNIAGKNLSEEEARRVLDHLKWMGIRNLFALQGDKSKLLEKRKRVSEDFPRAIDLVGFIRRHYGDHFTVGVAAYPDTHPDSRTVAEDVQFLQEKVRAGADYVLTQATFHDQNLMRFLRECQQNDVNVPVILGVFVANTYDDLVRVCSVCQVDLPQEFRENARKCSDMPAEFVEFYMRWLGKLIEKVPEENSALGGIHLFSFNKFDAVKEILARY